MYNEYMAFYKGKKAVIHTDTTYHAQLEAANVMGVKPKQRHMISIVLCESQGKQVEHTITN